MKKLITFLIFVFAQTMIFAQVADVGTSYGDLLRTHAVTVDNIDEVGRVAWETMLVDEDRYEVYYFIDGDSKVYLVCITGTINAVNSIALKYATEIEKNGYRLLDHGYVLSDDRVYAAKEIKDGSWAFYISTVGYYKHKLLEAAEKDRKL